METAESIGAHIGGTIAKALGMSVDEIDRDAPFADYGLDSVLALQMLGELEEQLDIQIDPSVLFEYPTINTLSEYLEQQ